MNRTVIALEASIEAVTNRSTAIRQTYILAQSLHIHLLHKASWCFHLNHYISSLLNYFDSDWVMSLVMICD